MIYWVIAVLIGTVIARDLCVHLVSENLDGAPYLATTTLLDAGEKIAALTQTGTVRAFAVNKGDGALTNEGLLLDISNIVDFEERTERGAFDIAAHPTVPDRYFVHYSSSETLRPELAQTCKTTGCLHSACDENADEDVACIYDHLTVVSEFSASGDGGSDCSRIRDVLVLQQPASNHNGGFMSFGRSDEDANFLYIALGDGGGALDPNNLAQNPQSPFGKILRLDPSSGNVFPSPAASGNPFIDDRNFLPEIYALGFRNPYRCSFDVASPHALLCGDVGQDTQEEIDLVEPGNNFGWKRFEGTFEASPDVSLYNEASHTEPIITYDHTDNGDVADSVTGGVFIRSGRDDSTEGNYVFADLFSGLYEADPTTFSAATVNSVCGSDTPIPCSSGTPSFILGFTTDRWYRDTYIATGTGLFRLVGNYHCNGAAECMTAIQTFCSSECSADSSSTDCQSCTETYFSGNPDGVCASVTAAEMSKYAEYVVFAKDRVPFISANSEMLDEADGSDCSGGGSAVYGSRFGIISPAIVILVVLCCTRG
eukprot:Clim_evm58s88 gene=Clim_evmTU58s88